jgi:lysophospholipase L1-like esterase
MQLLSAAQATILKVKTGRAICSLMVTALLGACHGAPGNAAANGSASTDGFTGPSTRFLGRVTAAADGSTTLSWGASTVLGRFMGSQIAVRLSNVGSAPNYFDVVIDQNPPLLVVTDGAQSTYTFPVSSGTHSIALVKRNEGTYGSASFGGFTTDGTLLPTATPPGRLIEFIGDSISNGYGAEGHPSANGADGSVATDCMASAANENAHLAFGPLTAAALHADYSVVAYAGRGVARNVDQSTTGLVPQLWTQRSPTDPNAAYDFATQPQAVVVNLGTNDLVVTDNAGNKIDPPQNFVQSYAGFLKAIASRYPGVPLVVTLGPMLSSNQNFASGAAQLSTGQALVKQAIAQANNSLISYLEFPPQSTLAANLGCAYHPNLATHRAMAAALAQQLRTLLNW